MPAVSHSAPDEMVSSAPPLHRSHSALVRQACDILTLPAAGPIEEDTAGQYDLFSRHIDLNPRKTSPLRRRTFLAYAFWRVLHRREIYRLPTLVSGLFVVPHSSLLRAEQSLCSIPQLKIAPLRWPARALMASACRWLRLKPPLERALSQAAQEVEERFFGRAPETIMINCLTEAKCYLNERAGLSPIEDGGPIVLSEVSQLFQIRRKVPAMHIGELVANALRAANI